MNRATLTRLLVFCAVLVALPAQAEPLETLGLQGRLISPAGSPVPDGDYGLTINFYKGKGDEKPIYVEVKPGVKVASGLFAVQVGAVTALNTAVFKAGEAGWVGMQVGSDQELPRVALQFVPYALRALNATELQCSGCIASSHLGADVLKPFAKVADLSVVATSGSYKDLKDIPVQVGVGQQCDVGSLASGFDAAGKVVCVVAANGKDFALANQVCAAGSMVTGVDAAGKVKCAAPAVYDGGDFALANQACAVGSMVAGVDAAGKVSCVVAKVYAGKDFALANQTCISGSVVTGVDIAGKVSCIAASVYGGKDFAMSSQACAVGSLVTGVDAAGKLQCVAAITYSGKDFALANQGCGAGSLVTGLDLAGKVTCATPKAYTGSDFALANQNCLPGSLVAGVTAAGKVTCLAVTVYTGKDFALSNKACAVGSVMSGIAADGTPACVAMQTYLAGTGLKLTGNTLSLDLPFLDAAYVGEGQAGSITTGMIKDGNVTGAKIEACAEGETLQMTGGKWTCTASAGYRTPGDNLLAGPTLSDVDGDALPDNAVRDVANVNWKFAKLLVNDLNAALGGATAHETINIWGVDLRSTTDGTTESLTFLHKVRPMQDASVWVDCSVYVRRPDGVGTTARAKLECFGKSATFDMPASDLTWHRISLSVQVASSTKIPTAMRVFGSGGATGGDSAFVRYAMPKIEYGKVATDWNSSSNSTPTGLIAFFAGPCPPGWTEYLPLRGRGVLGTPAGGQIAGAVGVALTNLGTRTIVDVPAHVHNVDPPNTSSTANGDHNHGVDPPNTTSTGVGDHAHNVDPPNTGTSGVGDHAHNVDPPNTGTTNNGQHGHNINTRQDDWNVSGGSGPSFGADNGTYQAYHGTEQAGLHSHTVDIGAFGSGAAGGHAHAVDIANFGSAGAGAHAHDTNVPAFNSANAGTHGHDTNVPAFNSASTGSASVDVTMPYLQLTACRAN